MPDHGAQVARVLLRAAVLVASALQGGCPLCWWPPLCGAGDRCEALPRPSRVQESDSPRAVVSSGPVSTSGVPALG